MFGRKKYIIRPKDKPPYSTFHAPVTTLLLAVVAEHAVVVLAALCEVRHGDSGGYARHLLRHVYHQPVVVVAVRTRHF